MFVPERWYGLQGRVPHFIVNVGSGHRGPGKHIKILFKMNSCTWAQKPF